MRLSKSKVPEFCFLLGRLNSPSTINPPIMVHPLSPISINGTSYHNRKVFLQKIIKIPILIYIQPWKWWQILLNQKWFYR